MYLICNIEGDILDIRCRQSVFKGKQMSVDADAVKIVDNGGYVVSLRGGTSWFHIYASSCIQAETLLCMRRLKAVLKVL